MKGQGNVCFQKKYCASYVKIRENNWKISKVHNCLGFLCLILGLYHILQRAQISCKLNTEITIIHVYEECMHPERTRASFLLSVER